jgi:hypothetical protein
MKKYLALGLSALALTAAVPATASADSSVTARAAGAPNVRCMWLDRAERKVQRAGYNVRIRGGGIFGVVVKSAWKVAFQRTKGHTVILFAARSC